jgi:hypothetical protein
MFINLNESLACCSRSLGALTTGDLALDELLMMTTHRRHSPPPSEAPRSPAERCFAAA